MAQSVGWQLHVACFAAATLGLDIWDCVSVICVCEERNRFARLPKALRRLPISDLWLQSRKLCQVAVASNDKKRFEISEESGKERAVISHTICASEQAASCAGFCQGRAGTLHEGRPSHRIGYVLAVARK